ncbi:MAG: glycosyltransferase family 4 protein [Anaerolineae bacterium]
MRHSIAILHYSAPPAIGGVENVLGHHARLMTQAGHSVRVVAAKGGESDCLGGASFYCFPLAGSQHEKILDTKKWLDQGVVPADFDELVQKIMNQMEEAFHGIDLLIAHNVCSLHKNLLLTAALRRFCAQPNAPRLIIWHHDFAWLSDRYQGELHGGYPWNLLCEDWPEVNASHVVVSEPRLHEFESLFKNRTKKAQVIPSGIDLERFLHLASETRQLFSEMALTQGDPVLLLPVRITRRKNIELALQIVSEMRKTFTNPILVVTGPPGPHNQDNLKYFQELISLRDLLGLNPINSNQGAVHFMAEHCIGHLPTEWIRDFFQMADGLILPSHEEGFGIPMLEAGLVGIPIFASEIDPLKAIGGSAVTWFSPVGDPAAIAQKITARLSEDSIFAFKKQVREHYVWAGVYAREIAPLLECSV